MEIEKVMPDLDRLSTAMERQAASLDRHSAALEKLPHDGTMATVGLAVGLILGFVVSVARRRNTT